RLMNTLRLFRLGSVHDVKYLISPDSILRRAFMSFGKDLSAPYKFDLSTRDAQSLLTFIARIKPLLLTLHGGNTTARQPADLSFARYSDAVLRGGDLEGRITAAITCLEALFLKGVER